jgi:hypothetical protein
VNESVYLFPTDNHNQSPEKQSELIVVNATGAPRKPDGNGGGHDQ